MDSSPALRGKKRKDASGPNLGTDGQHKNTKEVLCQEYILKSGSRDLPHRPKDDKHPVLLPVGESAENSHSQDKMILRVPRVKAKETRILVISMTPRTDAAENTTCLRKRVSLGIWERFTGAPGLSTGRRKEGIPRELDYETPIIFFLLWCSAMSAKLPAAGQSLHCAVESGSSCCQRSALCMAAQWFAHWMAL